MPVTEGEPTTPLNYTPHCLLRIGGPYGPEEWSINLRCQVGLVAGETALTDWDAICEQGLAPLSTVVAEWWEASKVFAAPGVKLGYIAFNRIGQDGKYATPNSHRWDFDPHVDGTGNTAYFRGPDTAVAVTLLTDAKRGYANKGRVYLPFNCLTNVTLGVGPDWGALNSAGISAIANPFKAFISALNSTSPNLASNGIKVGVFSPGTGKNQDPGTPGAWRRVSHIRVGAQLDTQRRRLNKQEDLWSSKGVTLAV